MWKDKHDRVFGSVDEAVDFCCAHNDNCPDCPLYGNNKQDFCNNTTEDIIAKLGLEEITDPDVIRMAMFFGVGKNAKEDAEREVEKFKKEKAVYSEEYNYVSGWPVVCCAAVTYKE